MLSGRLVGEVAFIDRVVVIVGGVVSPIVVLVTGIEEVNGANVEDTTTVGKSLVAIDGDGKVVVGVVPGVCGGSVGMGVGGGPVGVGNGGASVEVGIGGGPIGGPGRMIDMDGETGVDVIIPTGVLPVKMKEGKGGKVVEDDVTITVGNSVIAIDGEGREVMGVGGISVKSPRSSVTDGSVGGSVGAIEIGMDWVDEIGIVAVDEIDIDGGKVNEDDATRTVGNSGFAMDSEGSVVVGADMVSVALAPSSASGRSREGWRVRKWKGTMVDTSSGSLTTALTIKYTCTYNPTYYSNTSN